MIKGKAELIFKGNFSSIQVNNLDYRLQRAKLGIVKDIGEIQKKICMFSEQ